MMDDIFIELIKRNSWQSLVDGLRKVPLKGDKDVFPYKAAKILSKLARIEEVLPLSKYVLTDQLDLQRLLHRQLLAQHKIDTFNLDGGLGGIEFLVKGEKELWKMAPPIVEVSKVDANQAVLLDGEHRFMVAREMGVKQIRVVWIEGVPGYLPVVSMPANWEEIKQYEKTPAYFRKRNYRFKDLKSFPDISLFSKKRITQDNFRYFFYRDIDRVASTFIRPPEA